MAPIIGFDVLGLAHKKFPVKLLIDHLPDKSAIGVFDDPFGPVGEKLSRLLATGKHPIARVHLHWDSPLHRPIPIQKLKDKLPFWERFAKQHKNVQIYLSHSCEGVFKSRQELQERVKLIQRMAPSCIPVNSIWKGPILPGIVTERHGMTDKQGHPVIVEAGGIASPDGMNMFDGDVESYKKKNQQAFIIMGWGARFNGREDYDDEDGDGNPDVPPPAAREAWPDADYVNSIERILKPIGETPLLEPGMKPIKRPALWKTHAEDVEGNNSRDNKPLFICPEKDTHVKIIGVDGRLLGKLAYYGPYQGGGHRYYSGWRDGINEYGHRIARKAFKLTGSEWVKLVVRDTVYQWVNPAFRAGYFQNG